MTWNAGPAASTKPADTSPHPSLADILPELARLVGHQREINVALRSFASMLDGLTWSTPARIPDRETRLRMPLNTPRAANKPISG
jgi:hypothetical protein